MKGGSFRGFISAMAGIFFITTSSYDAIRRKRSDGDG